MKAYSTDLRERIVLAYENGDGTLGEMAETFGVARCTVGRLLKLARSGEGLAPKPHGGGSPTVLDEKRRALLRAQVEPQPDATLEELAAYLKKKARVQVHVSTICRALQWLDLPRKKKPRGLGAGRSRPAGFPPPSGPVGSSPSGLHRRDGLSFGDDESLRAGGARRKSQPERAAQPRHGGDGDRVFGPAWHARPAQP